MDTNTFNLDWKYCLRDLTQFVKQIDGRSSFRVSQGAIAAWKETYEPIVWINILMMVSLTERLFNKGSVGALTNRRFETARHLTYQRKQVFGLGHNIVTMAVRIHLFPYRTQKLSLLTPMVLGG